MTEIERGGAAYGLLPTDLAAAQSEGRAPREGLIRGSGGAVLLATDRAGELYVPGMTDEIRSRLESMSEADKLRLELVARARQLAKPTIASADGCSLHGFHHDDSRAWQMADIELMYEARAERSASAEAARRAADTE